MECGLVGVVSSNASVEFFPSVANILAEDVWCEGKVVEQCAAELSHLAAVETNDGGICVSERECRLLHC